jgi:hypothetical protein
MCSVKAVLTIFDMACSEGEAGKYMHSIIPIRSEASWLSLLANSRTLPYLWDWWHCDWQSWQINSHCYTCEIGGYVIGRAGKLMHTAIPMRLVALWLAEVANSCTLWDWWLCNCQCWQIHAHYCTYEIDDFMIGGAGKFMLTAIPVGSEALWWSELY